MREHQSCPQCGVDITEMDAQGFVDHMHAVHPDTYDLFKRVFASFDAADHTGRNDEPERCPTCKSDDRAEPRMGYEDQPDHLVPCPDPWHREAHSG